jgi:hypothetical protein
VLDTGDHPDWARVREGCFAGDLTGLTRELAACVSLADLAHMAATIDDLAPLTAVAEAVDRAKYWGPPDKEDRASTTRPCTKRCCPSPRPSLALRLNNSGQPGRDRQPAVRGVARRARQPARLDRRRRRLCCLAKLRPSTMSGQPESGRKTHLPREAATGGLRRSRHGFRQPRDRFLASKRWDWP